MGIQSNLAEKWLILVFLAVSIVGCGGAPQSDGGATGTTGGSSDNQISIGSGGGSSFSAGIANQTLLSANSESATWRVSVVVVGSDNLAVSDVYTVTFSSSCVAAGLASVDVAEVDTLAGRASVLYSSDTCDGVDTVVARVGSGDNEISATADLDIDDATGNSGGGTEGPVITMGNGTGSSYEDGVLSATATSLQAGGNTIIGATLVDVDGNPYTTPTQVTFSSGCVTSGTSLLSNDVLTTSGGAASTQYTANGCNGEDIVTANATVGDLDISASVSLSIATDTVLGVEFVSVSETILSLPGAGGDETAEVTFRLLGALGAPVINESVSFRLSSAIGGVAVAPGRESDVSDFNGEVSTTVQSGTVSTTFSVIATHDASGNLTTSDGIVVSSGIPVDSKFSASFSTFTPKDAFDTDGVELDVRIIASDYFGNDVPDGAQVFFASPESGNIDQSCVLESGECSVTWRSAGVRPADFRASVIAYIDGAEDFTDNNGNSVFDAADTMGLDLGEAFIDEDEDGSYEVGEFFVDANQNLVRDQGNTLWDGPCLSAVDASADCSGNDSLTIWKVGVIRMPTSTPRLISANVDYNGDGVSDQSLAEGDLIDMELSPNGILSVTFVVADDNVLADPFGGHPMPSGTGIFVNGDGSSTFNFSGDDAIEIPDQAISPTEFTVLILRDAEDTVYAEQFIDVSVHESFTQLSDELGEFTFRLRI
ncbi:MAG: hypothetical protein K6L80_13635 [Agarilytica sp.]